MSHSIGAGKLKKILFRLTHYRIRRTNVSLYYVTSTYIQTETSIISAYLLCDMQNDMDLLFFSHIVGSPIYILVPLLSK